MAASQDPNEYSIVLTMVGWSALLKAAITLNDRLAADGRPAQASLVRQAIFKLGDELKSIAAKTAVNAHASIQHAEQSSRVRPDTGGGGGPRLGDYIGFSTSFNPVPGTVLINHEPTLEDNDVAWWWTNEEGYAGHIGRRFIGAFDGTRPNPAEFRQHALLAIGRVPGAGKGQIKNPIPERRFVRTGAGIAEAHWHAEVRAAKSRYVSEIQFAVRQAQANARKRAGR